MLESIFSEAGFIFLGATACVAGVLYVLISSIVRSIYVHFSKRSRQKQWIDVTRDQRQRMDRILDEAEEPVASRKAQALDPAHDTDWQPTQNRRQTFGRREGTSDANHGQAANRTTECADVPDKVLETVSVILRRQVPIRDGAASRSWLGGLPMMPESIPWPRSVSHEYPDEGERPLHFLAQICCADLPEKLWGGLGPRDGWLLFFYDPNQHFPEDEGSFRILHTDEWGTERTAPSDLGPVHDGNYSGPSYQYLEGVGEVPKTWRRWPVDLVVVPNDPKEVDGRIMVVPDNYARVLYEGQEVSDERWPTSDPFTSRMALAVLSHIEARLTKYSFEADMPEPVYKGLKDPDVLAALTPDIPGAAARIKALNDALQEEENPQREESRAEWDRLKKMEQHLETAKRQAALLDRFPSADALRNYQRETAEAFEDWRIDARRLIREMKFELPSPETDTALPVGTWPDIKARLSALIFRYWVYYDFSKSRSVPDNIKMQEKEMALFSFYDSNSVQLGEFVADYYVDPERRALIPRDVIVRFEPFWRQLYGNRPHRIGGEFDELQSAPQIGPTALPLLLHVAGDNAMNWMWGDAGIVHFSISPKDLAEERFEKAIAVLECY